MREFHDEWVISLKFLRVLGTRSRFPFGESVAWDTLPRPEHNLNSNAGNPAALIRFSITETIIEFNITIGQQGLDQFISLVRSTEEPRWLPKMPCNCNESWLSEAFKARFSLLRPPVTIPRSHA